MGWYRSKTTTWSDHNCPAKSYPLPWCQTTSNGERIFWPHVWPYSQPDFLETVARSGLYSNLFGRKSTYWTLYHAKNYTLSLGVVEAASSSLVTQTKIGGSTEPPIFFYFLAKSLEISRFRDNDYRHLLPFLLGRMCLFFRNDDMLDHTCWFLGWFRAFFGILKAVPASRDYRLFFVYCDVISAPLHSHESASFIDNILYFAIASIRANNALKFSLAVSPMI